MKVNQKQQQYGVKCVSWTARKDRQIDRPTYAPRNYGIVKHVVHFCDVHIYTYVVCCVRYLTYLEDLPTQEVFFDR
jgi:hypothetical protein